VRANGILEEHELHGRMVDAVVDRALQKLDEVSRSLAFSLQPPSFILWMPLDRAKTALGSLRALGEFDEDLRQCRARAAVLLEAHAHEPIPLDAFALSQRGTNTSRSVNCGGFTWTSLVCLMMTSWWQFAALLSNVCMTMLWRLSAACVGALKLSHPSSQSSPKKTFKAPRLDLEHPEVVTLMPRKCTKNYPQVK